MLVDYGQRHARELAQAILLCRKAKVDFQICDLSALKPLLSGSSQTDDSVAVPYGHYTADTMKLTIVPNRNAIMLSFAIGWAVSTGAKEVYYACHAGDHVVYPDCRPEFVEAMDKTAQVGSGVRVLAPFVHMSKTQILAQGLRQGVPYELTHSCYEGGAIACGRCGTCVERLEAFALNGATDPIPYRVDPFFAYLAGFFDGEGCIVSRTNTGVTGRILTVIISQNWSRILQDIKEIYGGSLHRHRNRKTSNLAITSQPAAERFLKDVLPYLHVKKDEASLALEIFKVKGNDPVNLITRERLHDMLKEVQVKRREDLG